MRALLLAVLAVLFVGMSGCSGGDSGSTDPNTSISKTEGQSCSASNECKSGVCFGGVCTASGDGSVGAPAAQPATGDSGAQGSPTSAPPPGSPPGDSGTSTAPTPTAKLTTPADGATGVPLNTKIVVTFSEEMDASTITAGSTSGGTFMLISLANPETAHIPVPGSVSCNNPCTAATFTPSAPLRYHAQDLPADYFVLLDFLNIKSKKGVTLEAFIQGTFSTAAQ